MVNFSHQLKKLRTAQGLTQQQLADKIGMSRSSISMYEKGNRLPSYEAQEVFADYFNVDLDFLTGRSNRTTVVFSANGAEPKRRFLMDKIAKADDAKLRKIEKLMELIDDEETRDY